MRTPFVVAFSSFPSAVQLDFSDGARALISKQSEIDAEGEEAPIILSFFSKWGRFKGAAGITYLGAEMQGGAQAVFDALKSIDGAARYARPAREAIDALS